MLTSGDLCSQNYCIPGRFIDNYYFRSRDIHLETNVIYGQAFNYKGKMEILDLDLYRPKESIDTLMKKPFIMLIHGGSLGDKEKMEKYCPLFAQRGFVVANINRRKGRKNNEEIEELKEVYRALQDAHAAMRFLIRNADEYGIDTSAVFIGGVSAGAAISLAISYMNQQDFDNRYSAITESLGRMDNTSNQWNNKFSIRGVVDMWGQILDTTFISFGEAQTIPIIMFHGTTDNVTDPSPYKKALQLAKRYQSLGGCYQLHTKTGAGHTEGISRFYIAEKTGCFLKRILCDSCTSFEMEVDNQNSGCHNILSIDKSSISRTHIILDSSLLARYIGSYKTKGKVRSLKNLKIIIRSENGHLYVNMKKKNIEFQAELYAESEHDFFLRDENFQFTFDNNKKGQINGLTFYIDNKEIYAKKKK
jgi:predicted esterase